MPDQLLSVRHQGGKIWSHIRHTRRVYRFFRGFNPCINFIVRTAVVLLLLACPVLNGWAEPMPVQLDVKKAGSVISPMLFGHNLEVTRRGVWSGLSAEMVANRKFAAVQNNLPKRWETIGADGAVHIDANVAYAGKQSVWINVPEQGVPSGLKQQQKVLAVEKGKIYGVRVWLKTEGERQLRVRLTGETTQPFFDKVFSCKPGNWQLLNAKFVAPSTQTNCTLEITSQQAGAYWIGAVSVMPGDAFHGMRRDVIELLKTIKPGCLRYPGGCCAEFYTWQDGLLPVDQRPPIYHTGLDFLFRDTDDTDTHEIGIDEYIALCREIGCEPAITARLSEKTPEDAAAWVEYCNGDAKTKWGGIRAGRGHAKPYNVRWWFVGNELYYFGRGAARGAAGCAAQSRLFAEAMKKVDPKIQLVACSEGSSGWDTPLFESVSPLLHAGSLHQYILGDVPLKTVTDLSMLIKAPVQKALPKLQSFRKFIDQKQPGGRRLGITYDEWNTMWGHSGSIPMGLYVAGMLNMLCREAQPLGLEMACYFMPVNEGAIKVAPLSAEFDTAGHVFELYKVHQGNRLLKIPEGAAVDLCASLTPDGKRIYVTAVNDIIAEQTVQFSLANGTVARRSTATVKQLIPRALEIRETVFNLKEEKVAIAEGRRFEVTLPPGGIVRIAVDINQNQKEGD